MIAFHKFTENLKELSFIKYYIYLFILGYLPIIIFGTFIQDDWGILNLSNASIIHATENMCTVNNNRPLSCVYFAFLTRLIPNFQIYFLLIFFIYSLFIYFVCDIFNFLIKNENIKKIFVTFLIFPFFSYTIIYSPAMQGIGALSLLLWSISLFYLKKNLIDGKTYHLLLSYFFVLLIFLVYESSAPLLGISFFFPLIFKKYKIFIYNFLALILIMLLVYFLQKFLFPAIFEIDLSRIKLSASDYKKIVYLILINSALVVNIIFYSLEIFLIGFFYNLITLNLFFWVQFLSIIYIVLLNFKFKVQNFEEDIKSSNTSYVYFLMIISVLFLTILMHVLADTGIEFIKYNNRALTSLSFLLAFIMLILINFSKNFNQKILKKILFGIFFVLSFNFIFFQNNLVKERFDNYQIFKVLKTDTYEFKNEKKQMLFVIIDYHHLRELLSFNSHDTFNHLKNFKTFHPFIFRVVNEFKFCNKNYYDEYIKKAYLLRPNMYEFNLVMYGNYVNKPYYKIYNAKSDEIEKVFEEHFSCSSENQQVSSILNRKTYTDERYQGVFLNTLKSVYVKFK